MVKHAAAVAFAAHDGQLRKDGSPFITHLARPRRPLRPHAPCVRHPPLPSPPHTHPTSQLETAAILADLGFDESVVSAGLLHDTLDDSALRPAQLSALFPPDVVALVAGVSRMSAVSQLSRSAGGGLSEGELDNLRGMLVAMADVRVVLIKLADRLHNMRTVAALPEATARRMAAETLAVFAPLANRLGVWSLKAEMEDLCFAVLHPEEHSAMAAQARRRRLVVSPPCDAAAFAAVFLGAGRGARAPNPDPGPTPLPLRSWCSRRRRRRSWRPWSPSSPRWRRRT